LKEKRGQRRESELEKDMHSAAAPTRGRCFSCIEAESSQHWQVIINKPQCAANKAANQAESHSLAVNLWESIFFYLIYSGRLLLSSQLMTE
jgi:hypothetical protein